MATNSHTPAVPSNATHQHNKVRKKSWVKSEPANGRSDVIFEKHDAHPIIHSQSLKIICVGAACSGKSTLIRQFVGDGQGFADQYDPTEKKSSYFKTVLTFDTNNQRVTHWQLKIIDIPVTDVPLSNALVSWTNFLQFDVGNAAAYLLMFDVNAQFHSFDFVRTFREQLINHHQSTASSLIFIVGNKIDLPYQLNRSDLLQIIQKQWKLPFIECSAKRNYHVHELFQEIIQAVQTKQLAAKAQHSDGFRRNFKTSKCVIQ